MFIRISVLQTIELLVKMLLKRGLSSDIVEEFCTLITFWMYQFPDELQMGGLLSFLVADIFTSNMEQHILSTNPPAHRIGIDLWMMFCAFELVLKLTSPILRRSEPFSHRHKPNYGDRRSKYYYSHGGKRKLSYTTV